MSEVYFLQTNILLQADDFFEAYKRCIYGKNPKVEGGCTQYSVVNIPAIVNAAFACELYMKSLIKEKENKQGHDLKELFDKLTNETQEQIKQFVNEKLETQPFYSFDTLLDLAKNAFVEWRYIFEEEHTDGFMGCFINEYLMFFEYFVTALKDMAHKI